MLVPTVVSAAEPVGRVVAGRCPLVQRAAPFCGLRQRRHQIGGAVQHLLPGGPIESEGHPDAVERLVGIEQPEARAPVGGVVGEAVRGDEEGGQAVVQLDPVKVRLVGLGARRGLHRQLLEQLLQAGRVRLVDHQIAVRIPLVGDALGGERLHDLVLGGRGEHRDLVGDHGQVGVEDIDGGGGHLLDEQVHPGLVLATDHQHGAFPHVRYPLVGQHARQQATGLPRPRAAVVGDPVDLRLLRVLLEVRNLRLGRSGRSVRSLGAFAGEADGLVLGGLVGGFVTAHRDMLPRLGARGTRR